MRLGHDSISMPETVCQKPVQKDTWARLHAAQTELFYLYGPSEVNDRLYDDSGVDSSQGRKTTECDDFHIVISNRALYYIVTALVLVAIYG